MEIEEIAAEPPGQHPAGAGRSGGGPAGVPGARAGVRTRAQHQTGQPGGDRDHGLLSRLPGSRRDHGRDQSAGGHQGRSRSRTGCQDVLRRQRHVPPPQGHRNARLRRRGSARDAGGRVRAQLRGLERRHRLHHQRCRPGDGDDGHDQARGRRARQLPRRGRRRLAGACGGGIQSRALRSERQGHPGEYLCRHQSLRLGCAGRGAGGQGI